MSGSTLLALIRHKYANGWLILLGNAAFIGPVELFTNGEVLKKQLNDPARGGSC
jgi:hypothetical protein